MGLPCIGANSIFDTITPTTSPAADTSYPLARLYDDRSYNLFKNGSLSATVDIITDAGLGNTSAVNYLAILNHDLSQPAGAGAACLWTFAGSTNGSAYSTIDSGTPTDNKVIFRKFAANQAFRFYRLRITRAATFICSIGEMQWGTAVEFPYGINLDYDPQLEKIEGQLNRSQTGKIIGAIRKHTEKESHVKMELIDNSFVRGTAVGQFAQFWDNHGKLLKPFFWAWNPGDPGSFETDTYWAIIKPTFDLRRPLRTMVDSGMLDLEWTMEGEAE